MALDESAILRRAQRLSAPTRRALSSGLEKALMSTRYQENPNVAGMLTEKALSGYGAGLSSAVSAGEREALSIEQTEEQMRLEQERINMQRDAYSDQSDAATIGGITQLGLLGLTGYDLYNRWGGTTPALSGIGKTALSTGGGGGGSFGGVPGSNVASVANDMAINGITGTALSTGSSTAVAGMASQLGAPASLGADYAMISGYGGAGMAGGSTAATGVGAGGAAAGMAPGMAAGIIGAGIMAAPILGPPLTRFMKNLSQSLGMGKQTAPGAGNYLNALQGGADQYGGENATIQKIIANSTGVGTYSPERQVQEWMAMQKYGQWTAPEGGGQSYEGWLNQIPLSEAQALIDQYKARKAGIAYTPSQTQLGYIATEKAQALASKTVSSLWNTAGG